jgi:hypothetical protein
MAPDDSWLPSGGEDRTVYALGAAAGRQRPPERNCVHSEPRAAHGRGGSTRSGRLLSADFIFWCLGIAQGVGDALVGSVGLAVDAVGVDLQQDGDAVPGAAGDLGRGHPGVQPQAVGAWCRDCPGLDVGSGNGLWRQEPGRTVFVMFESAPAGERTWMRRRRTWRDPAGPARPPILRAAGRVTAAHGSPLAWLRPHPGGDVLAPR